MAVGGEVDKEQLYVSPTILTDVSPKSKARHTVTTINNRHLCIIPFIIIISSLSVVSVTFILITVLLHYCVQLDVPEGLLFGNLYLF